MPPYRTTLLLKARDARSCLVPQSASRRPYLRADSSNTFLLWIIRNARRVRYSHRYPGYLGVYHREYERALLDVLQREARRLIEGMGLEEKILDLEERLEDPNGAGLRDA